MRGIVEFFVIKALQWMPDLIIWSVSNWASRNKEFEEVYHHDLTRSWDACFQNRRPEKPTIISSWISPPEGVLKLNFDGSYL